MSGFGKAVWVHVPKEGPEAVRAVVRRLADAGFEVIIPCVTHPDGYANFHSKIAKVRPAFEAWDPLEVLCDEANRLQVQVHPWCCVFPEGHGSRLLEQHPEFVARDRQGQAVIGSHSARWACSARPEVQDYELAIYQELLDNYDASAVHLDYIRYLDANSCFCGYCRTEFQRHYDVDPVEIDESHLRMEDWIAWRVSQITRFVEQLHERASAAGKQISAAVFSDYPNCTWGVGQDWEDWCRRGLIDMIIPMNYAVSSTIARKRTRNHRHAVDGTVPIWEGLLVRRVTSTPMLVEQIESVLEEGAQGIVLFEYSGLYGRAVSDADLQAIKAIRAD